MTVRTIKIKKKSRKVRNRRKWSYKQIKAALKLADGFIRPACDLLGMSSSTTLHRYIDEDSRLKDLIIQLMEDNLDVAEHSVMQNIRDGIFPASQFLLKTKGAKRGYSETKNLNVVTSFELKLPDNFPMSPPKLVTEAVNGLIEGAVIDAE